MNDVGITNNSQVGLNPQHKMKLGPGVTNFVESPDLGKIINDR